MTVVEADRDDDGYPKMDARWGGSISAKFVKIINQPLPWLVLVAIIAGYAFANSISSVREAEEARQAAIRESTAAMEAAKIAERESRMAQYYILEVDGKLIRLGIDIPEGGFQRFKEKREAK